MATSSTGQNERRLFIIILLQTRKRLFSYGNRSERNHGRLCNRLHFRGLSFEIYTHLNVKVNA